jgi:hypothetical protein
MGQAEGENGGGRGPDQDMCKAVERVVQQTFGLGEQAEAAVGMGNGGQDGQQAERAGQACGNSARVTSSV